jgi:hypothetical protein
MKMMKRDFRVSPQYGLRRRTSGILRSVDWYLLAESPGQPVGSIFLFNAA